MPGRLISGTSHGRAFGLSRPRSHCCQGSHQHSSLPLTTSHWQPKGKQATVVSFIQTVDVTILLHQVTSISYKKLVPGLHLQVSMKGGMAEVQIQTNQMDSAQHPAGVPWLLTHDDTCPGAGEGLHLIRHLGAVGKKAYPREGGQLGIKSWPWPTVPTVSGQCTTEKPSVTAGEPQEALLGDTNCVHVRVRVSVHRG